MLSPAWPPPAPTRGAVSSCPVQGPPNSTYLHRKINKWIGIVPTLFMATLTHRENK